jgi:hypothetical protein
MAKTIKTKAQFIAGLRKLADLLETSDEIALESREFYFSAYTKEELLKHIKFFGGIWDKSLGFGETDIHLTSRELPLLISIPRDKVCRKTVTYDCEPMFSPDDEKELDSAMVGASA